MSGDLEIRLLGGLQILQNNTPLTNFISNKVPALFAYLAVTRRAHQRDALAALLWGEMSDADAKNNLRQALSNLRKFVDPHLIITRDTIQFNANAPHTLDVDLFTQGIQPNHSITHSPIHPISNLQSSISFYHGDFLQGFFVREAPEFEDWAYAERVRLRELAFHALHTLTVYHQTRGEYPQAIQTANRLLTFDPWREETHRDLILLHARNGQRSAALAQYETCRRVLAKELDVKPSAETIALYERIRAAGDTFPNNLTLRPTAFIGRTLELEHLESLFTRPDCRLITLLGQGGIGKTRLALQAARYALQRGLFLSGVFFVPLEGVDNLDLLPTAIAESCGLLFAGNQDPKTQVLTFLKSREILLILDNFEQLLDAVPWVVQVLQNAPRVQLLVTSRERLNVQWEWAVPIEGLDFPTGAILREQAAQAGAVQSSAVQLFIARAQAAQADFTLTPAVQASITRVCQLVAGTPLALELAAANVRYYTCAEIEAEITQNFDFLSTNFRDLPTRQRSLRAVFEYSWHLLAPQERQAFTAFSAFRGGFSQDAAKQVGRATSPLLTGLVDKSLLRQDEQGRYHLHEMLRQYADGKLRAGPEAFLDARARHAEYYARFLQQRETDLNGPRQKEALDEIAAEIENVRAAWSWAVERGEEHAINISAEALYLFYRMRGYFQEGAEMFGRAAEELTGAQATARGDEHDLIVGKVLGRHGTFWYHLGRFREADLRLRQSLTTLRRLDAQGELAFALKHLGDIARVLGNYAEASRFLEEAIEIRAHVGDRPGQAFALLSLAGVAAVEQGNYERARQLCEEGLAICREAGDRQAVAQFLTALGIVAQTTGDYAAAASLLRECLATYQALNEPNGAALTLYNLALVARALGEHTQASQLCQESLTVYSEIGDQSGVAECLMTLGEIACASGRAAYQDSENYFHSALRVARDTQETPVMLSALAGLATLWVKQEKWEKALELADLIRRHPATSQETRDRAGQLLSELEAQLPAPILAAAQERGRARVLEEVAADVLDWSQIKLDV